MRNSLINRALVAKTKLFNYALLAAALLVGVNVNAQEEVVAKIGEKTYTSLQTAFNEALDGQTIEYAYKSTTYDMGEACVGLNAAKSITLDLKGNEIIGQGQTDDPKYVMFRIQQGTLTVKNGKISQIRNTTTGTCSIFYIYGDNYCHFENDGKTPSVWSKLVLAEDVELESSLNGVVVESVDGSVSVSCNVFVEILGNISAHKYGVKINGTIKKPAAGNVVKKTTPNETIASEKVDDYMKCIPYVHVAKSATITGDGSNPNSNGFYASGYGKVVINGTVSGATGVYIKGGEVVIDGANISSNSPTYTEAKYKDGHQVSGTDASGSAIIIEGTNGSAYSGGSVTITGDATITAGGGYGIEGLNFNQGGQSKIEGITIESGTISGTNGEGTINLSVDVANKVKQEGTITGGTYDDGKIEDIISDVKGVITPVTDEDGNTSYVVTPVSGGKTAAEARVLCDTTHATTDIMLKESLNLTADNAKCKNLVVEEGATLTINNKLTVYGTLTIQGNVIVKAGATLIVEGNGITCLNVSKLVIEATRENKGMFYLNPNATGNFHPKATVKYVTEAIDYENSDRIGVPAYNGMQVKDILFDCTIKMAIFDNATGWVDVTSMEQYLAPFQGITIRTNATTPPTLQFPCDLVGNANADLTFYAKWNTFSNSYTANADLTPFLQEQINAGENALLEATIHKFNPTDANQLWETITFTSIEDGEKDGKLTPMQAIVIRNKTSQTSDISLSYKDNVWATRPGAPAILNAPKFAQSNVNKAVINLTSVNGLTDKLTIREADQYTEQFDNGADATKYPNSIFNMYVATEFGDLCQLASNNVEGQVITLATTNETEFTMSFSNVRGEKMALVDNITGDVIEMAEGVTYNFFANANEVSERFTVVAAAQAPTALKNAENKAKAAKFINNGQIVLQNNGRMFNVLGIEVK